MCLTFIGSTEALTYGFMGLIFKTFYNTYKCLLQLKFVSECISSPSLEICIKIHLIIKLFFLVLYLGLTDAQELLLALFSVTTHAHI